MFTVNTDIVVFQLSLNNFLENLKTQETVVFDEITLNEGKVSKVGLNVRRLKLKTFLFLNDNFIVHCV